MTQHFFVRSVRLVALVAALVVAAGHETAVADSADGTVDLSTTPPDLTSSVDPNIVVSFDDSGSMMATAMPDAIASTGHFDEEYYYSPTTNVIYFDPNKTYPPPLKPDGSSFPNSSYTRAPRDGLCANWPGSYCYGSANYVDLSRNFYKDFAQVVTGSPSSANSTNRSQDEIPSGIRGSRYGGGFYYDCPTIDSNYGCDRVRINDEPAAVQQNFANWYSYYRMRNLMTRTALTRVFGNLGENLRVAWQTINGAPAIESDTGIEALAGDWRDDFFSFLYDVQADGNTPNRRATIRAGNFFKRSLTESNLNPYWNGKSGDDSANLACRQNYHMLVTDGYWNWSSNPSLPDPFQTSESSVTLPDDVKFDTGRNETKIFWNVNGSQYTSSLANIAFHYWATDLQPTLDDIVAPYIPDKTTGVTGTDPLGVDEDPLDNYEVYWNPKNDPATWQHVVQFMITLGVAGRRAWPGDYDALRAGTLDWPRPENFEPEAVDDTWHAAINSRGTYFSANDPDSLVSYLTNVIASILIRAGSSTQPTLSSPIATASGAAFGAGYDSSDWSGTVTRYTAFDANGDPIDPAPKVWEAGCQLSGTACPDGSTSAARDPDDREIFTSDGTPGSGKAFAWANLSTAQQDALNIDPVSIGADPDPATWTSDSYGDERVDYIRGDRTYEVGGTPQFRRRNSVLGAVINAQPVYNASPDSGWYDNFPAGSPEALAVATASYGKFVNDNKDREAMIYVGANDGMLHAFDAVTGEEQWAYVPNALFTNHNLSRMTDRNRGLVPTVDSKPRIQDVFLDGAWKTVLVGSLRLGGRGVYALDVTDPANITESGAANVPLWEFTNLSDGGANLGYTYASPNIARLNNGKWVVLVSSGYYPDGPTVDPYDDPAGKETAAKQTSLFVINLETGALIREIATSSAPQFGTTVTYGLSTPGVYDVGGDQVDDLAVAGDLAGNVWRFDLSSADPSQWKVDLMFQTYPANTGDATDKCDAVGECPVSVMPVGMRNPATRGLVWIFGTGKFIGDEDRTSDIPGQAFYGVFDYGTAATEYPILPGDLLEQNLSQSGLFRNLSREQISAEAPEQGWTIPLDIATEPGERNVVTPFALDQSNRIVLPTLIPTSNDPCRPGRRGSLMIVDAATGGAPVGVSPVSSTIGGSSDPANAAGEVGLVDESGAIPASGELSPYTPVGGGSIGILGIEGLEIFDNYWHRSSWRELMDAQ